VGHSSSTNLIGKRFAVAEQFTAKSLSRLLRNVEREVLVEAINDSEIDFLFVGRHRDTLDELQTLFNGLANLATFGPQIIENFLADSNREVATNLEFFAKLAEAIINIGEFVGTINDVVEVLLPRRLDRIQAGISALLDVPTPDIPAEDVVGAIADIRRTQRMLNSYLSLDHEQYHRGFDADRRLGLIQSELQKALDKLL